MKIALHCATKRGLMVLRKLKELAPTAEIRVFSFREEAWEPPYLNALREEAGEIFYGFPGYDFDLLLAVNWRFIIEPEIYERARIGAYVFHDSMLPAYRGFSPTVWAMINGEQNTGVTLFRMSKGADEGNILAQRAVPIGLTETIATVSERVSRVYLDLLEENFLHMAGGVPGFPQTGTPTYCCKRLPSDNKINWNDPTENILNLIRAVTSPYPGAWSTINGKKLIVWEASFVESKIYAGRVPGRVVEIIPGVGIVVLTQDGSILLTRLQFVGQPISTTGEFGLSTTLGT